MKSTGPVKTGAGRGRPLQMRGTGLVRQGAPQRPSTAAPARPGTPAVAGTPNTALETTLTPEQFMASYDRRAANRGTLQEAERSDKEALAQHDLALSELNRSRALQAQHATDNLIARGMLQSGTAAGALGDIELAASKQREALNSALASTQLRNVAIRQNIIADEEEQARQDARQAQMNIAEGAVPGSLGGTPAVPGQTSRPTPGYVPSTAKPRITGQSPQRTTTTRPKGPTATKGAGFGHAPRPKPTRMMATGPVKASPARGR